MLTYNVDTLMAMVQYQQDRALSEARRNHLARLSRAERRQGRWSPWRMPRLEDVLAVEFACTLNPAAC